MKGITNGNVVAAAGLTGFPARLVASGLVSRHDLSVAEQHALREQMDLVDAVVALGLATETDGYRALSAGIGAEYVDLLEVASSELAIRLVPERLARCHSIVPLSVDNRVLRFATCHPFNPEAERDVAFASGRRTQMVIATRSGVFDALDRCYPKLRQLDVLAERLRSERPAVESAEPSSPASDAVSTVIELCDKPFDPEVLLSRVDAVFRRLKVMAA